MTSHRTKQVKTPEEIARTQKAIDEETHLHTDENNDEPTSTEIGETHYDEEFPQDEAVACQAPIQHPIRYR